MEQLADNKESDVRALRLLSAAVLHRILPTQHRFAAQRADWLILG